MDELLRSSDLNSICTTALKKISSGAATVCSVYNPWELMWHFLHNPMSFLP